MAAIHTNTVPAGIRWNAVLNAFSGLDGLFDLALRRASAARAAAQLRTMPDYLLADLGISRHEIDRVVQGERR